MTWSIHRLISVMQHSTIEDLVNPYNDISGKEIIYQEHIYSFRSDNSILLQLKYFVAIEIFVAIAIFCCNRNIFYRKRKIEYGA